MNRNIAIIFIIFLFILSILILCSCNQEQSRQQTLNKKQAIIDARHATNEVHLEYLRCYALSPKEKQTCTRQLTQKYLPKEWQNNIYYTTNYQYEAEKQGFVKFLYNNKLACNNLTTSPIFIDATKAYLVICHNGNKYFLKFDYKTKEWKKY